MHPGCIGNVVREKPEMAGARGMPAGAQHARRMHVTSRRARFYYLVRYWSDVG
jgi:hypothetical protein